MNMIYYQGSLIILPVERAQLGIMAFATALTSSTPLQHSPPPLQNMPLSRST
eukprot:COSAG05_NODE_307_length_11680_cov_162.848804_9_plen_52_part_00